MKRAIEFGTTSDPLTPADIEDVHRTLLRFTEDADIAGVVREAQNWIGGNDYNPIGATYVPPPHERVRPLLEDLCAFVNRTDLAAIVQAAIAHAQFETIRPFADGDGRVGRALIYMILRRRGETANYIPADQPHPRGGAKGVRRRARRLSRRRRKRVAGSVRRRDRTSGRGSRTAR